MSAACISSKPPAIATPGRPEPFDLGDIAAGAEVPARPTDHDHVHGRLGRQVAKRVFELDGEFDGHRVHLLGPVQRDLPDAVGDPALHGHRPVQSSS
jgi:hypothetical protein